MHSGSRFLCAFPYPWRPGDYNLAFYSMCEMWKAKELNQADPLNHYSMEYIRDPDFCCSGIFSSRLRALIKHYIGGHFNCIPLPNKLLRSQIGPASQADLRFGTRQKQN